MENLKDFDRCCERVLDMVELKSDGNGVWEDLVIRHVVEKPSDQKWESISWVTRGQQSMAHFAQMAINHLIETKRIHEVPGKTQATGRRLLRPTNILDSIVQSL